MEENFRNSCSKQQKELIIRALVDPEFKKMLENSPAKAYGVDKITSKQEEELKLVLAAIKGIDTQISVIADSLFCQSMSK